jgi:hypothetical protein
LDSLIGGGTYTENLNANALEGLRIGILKELSGPVSTITSRKKGNLDKEILAAMDAAVAELKACGAEVVEVSFPKIFTLSDACSQNASKARKNFYAAFEKLLTDNDVAAVIFPTYLHAPQWRGVSESGTLKVYEQNFVTNVMVLSPPLGIPEITIPIGTHSRGAGIGMEIASLRNSEQMLLDIAYSYTTRYDHRVIPTGAPDLYAEHSGATLSEIIADYREALSAPETTPEPETSLPETTEPSTTEPSTTEPNTTDVGVSTTEPDTTSAPESVITDEPHTSDAGDAISTILILLGAVVVLLAVFWIYSIRTR